MWELVILHIQMCHQNFSLEIFGLPCQGEFPLPSDCWQAVWASFSSLILINTWVPKQGLILTVSTSSQFNLSTLWCDEGAHRFWFTKINFLYQLTVMTSSSGIVPVILAFMPSTSEAVAFPPALHTIPVSGNYNHPAVRDIFLSTYQSRLELGHFFWLIGK